MLKLKGFQRSYFMKEAHDLKPVVQIGKGGPSNEVCEAIKKALADHEMIKVKFGDFKENRKEIARDIETKVEAVLISVIGNIAIYYKMAEKPEDRKYSLPQR